MKLLASVNGQTVDSMPITEVLIKFLEHRLNVFNAHCTRECHQNYHPKKWRTLQKTSCCWAEEYATSELCRSIMRTVIKFLLD